MHGIRDIIGKVHDLRLGTFAAFDRTISKPTVDILVFVEVTELWRLLLSTVSSGKRFRQAPRVLAARVKGSPREIQPDACAVRGESLGLEAGEDAEGLSVTFEPTKA